MLEIDVMGFCMAYVASAPALSQPQAVGLHNLVSAIAGDPDVSDPRWAAYMLATVRHECGDRWLPVEEVGKGQGRAYGEPVQVQDANGTVYTNTYYGRGYVQLTWRLNYARAGRALGMGSALVLHPDHLLEPLTAYRVMSYGMRSGIFTGKKLADFIHDGVCDYVNARRIINGLDCAQRIGGYARQFEALLAKSAVAAASA